ncbi:MAG: hypothetical protein EA402_01150 [Planctomycetota bacterium]|nr:MAG: hypothetical protein EA402_01150 [Planctomycetota bacterium]
MASPRRIFNIYQQLRIDAQTIHDFQVARGSRISGTVKLLLAGDADLLLRRWGEEMHELCGVLEGSHDDPYVMEATQTWYWACCLAAVRGCNWEALDFEELRLSASRASIPDTNHLRSAVDRLVALGGQAAPLKKVFLIWCVADGLYRQQTPPAQQRSLEEVMEIDLQDMKKRDYLLPILTQVSD